MLHTTEEHQLTFRFPEVHAEAKLTVELQRTLRIPDDGKDYPLPAGLGRFPIDHVDDHAARVPKHWLQRGGVMVPIHQSEALWLKFTTEHITNQGKYPFAIKVGTGKINAITGTDWGSGINREPQNYVVSPKQAWLDGYAVGTGVVRQFVAMPLYKGYSAEEQITGSSTFGGIQIQAYPMKRSIFEKRFPVTPPARFSIRSDHSVKYFETEPLRRKSTAEMGVAPGGLIAQQIFDDEYELSDWDTTQSNRCFIHLCNSLQWRALTGKKTPTKPISSKQYQKAGLPWFKYYKEKASHTKGSAKLAGLETVADHAKTIGDTPLSDNQTPQSIPVIDISGKPVDDRNW